MISGLTSPHDRLVPVMLYILHSSSIAKVSGTSSHMYVRVTLVIRWFIAVHFGTDAGSQIFRLHGLNTANVGCSRDISLHSATGMGERAGQRVAQHLHPRRCFENEPPAVYEARFGDDAGLRIFRTHCLNTANEGSSHDTSLDAATGSVRRCRAVHPGDNACLFEFRVHSRYTLLGNSSVEFHGHCAAGLREARELGEGKHNIQDRVLCRRALPKQDLREARQASCQPAHVGVSLFFV